MNKTTTLAIDLAIGRVHISTDHPATTVYKEWFGSLCVDECCLGRRPFG
jgi:hypothetical protein